MSDLSLTQAVSTAPVAKPMPYEIVSARAPVAGGGEIGRGKSTRTDAPFVIFEHGRNQQALSLQAVAAAIYHGVITRDEIAALHKKADEDAKKAGGR